MSETTLTGVAAEAGTTEEQQATDFVESLVGDGKKYANVQELAKAYVNADLHINELRTKLDTTTRQEELLREVLNKLQSNPPTKPDEGTTRTEDPPVANKEVDIEKQVTEVLNRKADEDRKRANVQTSIEKLSEKYGSRDKAFQAINTFIGKDENLKQMVDQLSFTNPDALLKLMIAQVPVDQPTGTQTVTPGLDKSSPGSVIPPAGLTWTYCKQLRKDKPAEYSSRDFRAKMEKAVADYAARGQDFFAT